MSDARAGQSILVLNKVAALLDVLARDGELTAAEIAAISGEPRSSVYRLLGSLTELDFVEPGARRGGFRLGLGLLRLGSAVIERFNVRQAALPAMEALHQETGETIFLCIRRDFEAVCVERLEGERVQSLALRLGGAMPLHVGGAPLVLLAYEPRTFWERYTEERDLAVPVAEAARSRAALTEELERVRERGYAISDEDITPGIAAVGAPLLGHDARIEGALSISGTKPMILGDQLDATVELVTPAARDASRSMGYVDAG
jgi:DNA-binding IclR family transcriptional regulator